MDIITKGQGPIIGAGELLYELSKQIQWSRPEYGEQHLVVVLGGIHTDMDALRCIANGNG